MRQALVLARRGEGRTRPNPPVGAVVVRGRRLLGAGWHHRAGGPHAEVEAIRACAGVPRGATLYVTLEPCCTTGRTPPCTDLILASGLRRVVVGCVDPNPRHAGRGLELLRQAGLEVVCGVCQTQAEALIEPFATRLRLGRPFVTLKLALTLDGRIADRDGLSRWITGPPARAWVQRARRRCDALLVGAGTVLADDPSLCCRLPGAQVAWRVIVDGRGRVAPEARVVTDAAASRTLMVTTRAVPSVRREAWTTHGARVWTLPGSRGRVDLADLLRRLAAEGLLHVLCEGGGDLAGDLVRHGLVDAYAFFYAPLLLGDAAARPGLAGVDLRLPQARRLAVQRLRRLGDDWLIEARPAPEASACLPV